MQFITDEQIEKQKQHELFTQKVEKKKELNEINSVAQNKEDEPMTNSEFFKCLQKSKAPKPQQITMKDIKLQLDIQEMVEEKKKEEIQKLLNDGEMKEIKQELVGVMAMPHFGDKRKIFTALLNESDTINGYVNDNILFRFFNRANSHIKFGTVYAIKYAKTNLIYNELLRQQQANIKKEEPQKEATQKEESQKEEPKKD